MVSSWLMQCRLALAVCFFSALTYTTAQDSPAHANSASIEGMVVQEPGSQPLKKVLLEIVGADQKQTNNYTVTTDADGHFSVENVAPGRYRLYLERTGYLAMTAHGHRSNNDILTVAPGQQIKDLLFRMLPTAAITGRVVDEDGEPMSGVLISARRKGPNKSRTQQAGGDRTNDHGEYRLAGLFPGQYFVVAVPSPDARDYVHPSVDSPQDQSRLNTRYPITYYPSTTDSTQASAISLSPGDEMPLNFTLAPVKTYRVRGIVRGGQHGQKFTVQLFPKGMHEWLPTVEAEVGADGQFEVRRVTPGSYIAVLSGAESDSTVSAHEDATVVAGDVEGIQLVPMKPFTLTGHLQFDGRPMDPTQYVLSLQSADGLDDLPLSWTSGGGNAKPDYVGDFRWTMVNPGSYYVRVLGGESGESFVKSMSLGAVKTDTSFTVSGPASIEVVVSFSAGVVEGVVLDKDQPVANASVVAIPEEKYRKLHQRFAVDSTDQNGHFSLHRLAPGSYTIFAWQDLDGELYYDADFLKSQEANGTALKVEEGSRQRIQVKLSPIGEGWE